MKTQLIFILTLLLIFPVLIRPQEKQLFGFDELDWDSSKEVVKDFMNTRYDMLPGYEKEDALGYHGGRYLNQNLFLWVYFFNDEGLQEVDLVVKNSNSPVDGIFHEVVHSLTQEYGDPDLYKQDDWVAEWFYFDFPGKHLNATIKVSPYSNENMTSIKVSYLKIAD